MHKIGLCASLDMLSRERTSLGSASSHHMFVLFWGKGCLRNMSKPALEHNVQEVAGFFYLLFSCGLDTFCLHPRRFA